MTASLVHTWETMLPAVLQLLRLRLAQEDPADVDGHSVASNYFAVVVAVDAAAAADLFVTLTPTPCCFLITILRLAGKPRECHAQSFQERIVLVRAFVSMPNATSLLHVSPETL